MEMFWKRNSLSQSCCYFFQWSCFQLHWTHLRQCTYLWYCSWYCQRISLCTKLQGTCSMGQTLLRFNYRQAAKEYFVIVTAHEIPKSGRLAVSLFRHVKQVFVSTNSSQWPREKPFSEAIIEVCCKVHYHIQTDSASWNNGAFPD